MLLTPKAAAKRLARTIQRLKAKGEPKPFAGPAESAFLLSPELGAFATALPGLVHAKLDETWEDSGLAVRNRGAPAGPHLRVRLGAQAYPSLNSSNAAAVIASTPVAMVGS